MNKNINNFFISEKNANSFYISKKNINKIINCEKLLNFSNIKLQKLKCLFFKNKSNINETITDNEIITEKVSFTDEQKEAIFSRDKNLLVSASAGSGKTTVMTQRIIEIINSERVPITQFLIVTFTSASADDMKSKIIDKLHKLPKSDFILKQIDDVMVSDISDLHSFYSRLVSTYFYEVNLDPNFHIIDALQANLLKQRAISKVFEKAEEESPSDYYRLFDIIQTNRTDEKLKAIIFTLSDFFASIFDSDKWFNEKLESVYNVNIEKNVSAIGLKNYLVDFAQNAIEDIKQFLSLCPNCKTYNEYYQNLIIAFSMFSKEKSFKDNAKILFNITFPDFRKTKDEYIIFHEEGAKLKKALKENIDKLKAYFVSDDIDVLSSNILKVKNDVILLYNFTKKFDYEYALLKKDMGVLDFNDLERYSLKILSNPNICSTIKNKYKYIFVDEYQDINEIQEKIITLISSTKNRFMVGDIKQSIYGFRLCDPEIFLSKYREFERPSTINQVIKLNCNFRSDKNILKFVDDICSRFMTERFGGINYARDSIFVPGENNLDNKGSVNLCFIDTGKEEQDVIKNQVYSVKNHINQGQVVSSGKLEARLVAQKIAEIINDNNINPEEIDFSDFAILYFTKSKTVMEFIDEFKKIGFPVSVDKNGDLVQKSYIQEVLNFVKICVNGKDDFVLFKVLKSKLFNFTDNEIVKIRLINQSIPFYDVIYDYENLEDLDLKNKVFHFIEKVIFYKRCSQILNIKDFCKKIIKDFKLEKLNLISKDGQIFNEDLHTFLTALPSESVVGFLENYNDFSLESASCGGEKAVNIMTVHKSKGMEFKYVFIINTGGKLSYQSANSSVLVDKNHMIGINYYDYKTRTENQTLPMSMCKVAIRKKLAEEQLRVFYVALTRAKIKLFVICSKDKKTLSSSISSTPTSYSNWIEFLILHKLEEGSKEKYSYINFESFDKMSFESQVEHEKPNLVLQKQNIDLPETFNYKYVNSIGIPLKNSVSKILKLKDNELKEDEFDDNFEKQETELSNEFLISSANRGTAYHKFFQNVNFSCNDNFYLQFDNILNKLTDEEKKYINLDNCKQILSNQFFKEISKMRVVTEREFFAEIPATIINDKASAFDNIMMQGVIDFVAISEKEIYVLDYKTGKITDEKMEKYSFQLDIYSKICEKAFSLPVTKKILCFIDELKFIKI